MPGLKPIPLSERFWCKVNKAENTDSCWPWLGALKPGLHQGYGIVAASRPEKRTLRAHRVAYEAIVGPIPDGYELDHLCRNHGCVNPHHLEAVSHKVNVLRGTSPLADHARKTKCIHGHPFTEDNIYVKRRAGRIGRDCRVCALSRMRDYSRRKWTARKETVT